MRTAAILAGLAGLLIGGSASAQGPSAATIASDIAAQRCITGVAPAAAKCRVAGFSSLGNAGGRQWSWYLYDARSGDSKNPRRESYSVVTSTDPANPGVQVLTLTVPGPARVVDRWERSPYPVASITRIGEADYLGFTAQENDDGTPTGLYRLEEAGWKRIPTAGLNGQLEEKIATIAPAGCRPDAPGVFDWRKLHVRYTLFDGYGRCGVAQVYLEMGENGLVVTDGFFKR